MSLGDYSPLPSEKASEESMDEHDNFLVPHRKTKKVKILWIIIISLVSILIVSIISIVWLYSLVSSQKCLDPQELKKDTPSGLLDAQSFFPPVPPAFMAFHDPEGEGFQDPGEVGDRLWRDMVPTGGGYFALPNPRKYDIPPSTPMPNRTDGAEQYGTALIHNFHCLTSIRRAVIESGRSLSVFPFTADRVGHLLHCLDYLRQSAICAGDLTVEWAELQHDDEGNTWWFIPGDRAVHQCRDYTFIKQHLESIRLYG